MKQSFLILVGFGGSNIMKNDTAGAGNLEIKGECRDENIVSGNLKEK